MPAAERENRAGSAAETVSGAVCAEAPAVSIVIPCYNLAHLLRQCVEPVLSQTYRNFEVLVMDNCSPDDTPAVAASFGDARVVHIRHERNLGHVGNFNEGIRRARGKYVWLISADDAPRSPYVLERFVELMEREPAVGYVFCRAVELRAGEEAGVVRWTDCGPQDRIWDGPAFLERLIRANCIVMSSCMVRKECYDKAFPFSPDFPYACDWYLWNTLALHHRVAYFAEPMLYWRTHDDSLTSQFSRDGGRVFPVDDVGVLWRTGRDAERAGLPGLLELCKRSIAHRAAGMLIAEGRHQGTGISEAGLERILRDQVQDEAAERDLLARVCTDVGDEQYRVHKHREAAASYRRALRLGRRTARLWIKYVLLKMGAAGTVVRKLAAAAGLGET
jgi:hypothetical protein